MTTANLGMLEVTTNLTQPDLPVNADFLILDALMPRRVVDKDLSAPPTVADADRGKVYIVKATGTGLWSGKDKCLAIVKGAASWHFVTPQSGVRYYVIDEGVFYQYDGSAWGIAANTLRPIVVAASDETTALTTGTGKVTFRNPYATAFNVTGVKASLSTAQTSGSIFTIDINEGGTSILSTKLTIDNTEKTSTTAATAAVISDASIAADAEISIDIDQVGDGTAKGLKVVLIGYPS